MMHSIAPPPSPPAAPQPSQPPLRFPLTRRQTLFWLDEQLYPNTPYHHVVLRVTLRGALDVERWRSAYRETVLAFDQFRLVFQHDDGEPYQRFREDFAADLPVVDLSTQPELLETWIQSRAAPRFNFAEALFDGALLKLSDTHYVFFFCQHHIISDGTSVSLFLHDLVQRYAGNGTPRRPSYALYLAEEQAYRSSPRAQRAEAHFQARLPKDMPPLSMYGRTRQSRTAHVCREHLALGEARNEQLRELVQDTRIELIDPAMSRLVALSTLLFAFMARVSRDKTLVLATPIPNRSAELLGVGGLLMEQLFLRVDIEPDETFASLADKVRKELFAALRHGRYCVSDRGLSFVSLNLLRVHRPKLPDIDIEVALTPVDTMTPTTPPAEGDLRDTFALHVIGFDEGEPLTLGFDFHADTFDAPLRERAKGHMLALFDAMLGDLNRKIFAVEIVSPQERALLLELSRGVDPVDDAPDPLTRFAQVAAERSSATALYFAGRDTSYGELFTQVGQLAARLAEVGVKQGARVAFCTPRCGDELLSMLASWCVGAAYVPLDISHPPERLHMVLEDAAPDVLITHRPLLKRLAPPASLRVLLLDEEREALAERAPLALSAPNDPEQPAYVLFTSGSTGRPKGVVVPRRAIANFLRSMAHTPGLVPGDRLLSVTTTTFDIAALELFLPLWVGATVCIASRDAVLDAHVLRETIERDGINVMQATPTTWRLLLEAGFEQSPLPLKMLCGGEAISMELATRLLRTGGELWNMYGPTETTVWSTVQKLGLEQSAITIGRPIDATQVYVLSAHGALEPHGVTGELCIGGRGVSLGYLDKPALTAERFIQNPHHHDRDVIYRTGDLARFLPTGELECLGRLDHQVKVRGFRVELGEIESCLRRVDVVQEVVVAALGPSDDPRLVGYFVASQQLPAAQVESALRAEAHRTLPHYMQPVAYVQLPALPLNTNGKVDKKQLPAPDWNKSHYDSAHQFENDQQLQIAALFHELLPGVDVPLDKDFFLLGGDSVRAIQLRRRIKEELGCELPLNVLFESPTVRHLANALRKGNTSSGPLFVRLRRGKSDQPPLICIMGIALYRDLALALATERSVYGVHVPLTLTPGLPIPSVEQIARLYTELILQKFPSGPYHLSGLCFGGLVAFEVAHQLIAHGHRVETLAIFDGLLPRGMRYSGLAHTRALLRDPRHLLKRLRERGERLLERLQPASADDVPAPPLTLDLALQGPEAAALARRYDRHARPLPIPFTLFRAHDRQDAAWYEIDAMLGWGALGSPVTVHSVPGNHLSILQRGHVAAIAHVLSATLAGGSRHSRPPTASMGPATAKR